MRLPQYLLLATICTLTVNSFGQEKQPSSSATATSKSEPVHYERVLYTAHNLRADTLAEKLSLVFNAPNSPHTTVVDVPGTNCLLLSAPPEALQQMAEFLEQLDRQPQLLSIDVWIVNLQPELAKAADGASTDREPVQFVLPESRANVEEQLNKLEKAGQAIVVDHCHLAAMDGQETFSQQGMRKPRITSSVVTTRGTINTTTMDNLGTIVKVTPHITTNGQITLTLDVEKSFFGPEGSGVVISKSTTGEELHTLTYNTMLCKTTVSLKGSDVIKVEGVKCNPEAATGNFQILVSAELATAEKPVSK